MMRSRLVQMLPPRSDSNRSSATSSSQSERTVAFALLSAAGRENGCSLVIDSQALLTETRSAATLPQRAGRSPRRLAAPAAQDL